MGIKDIKAAFEEALGGAYSCSLATMANVPAHGIEFQVLFFRGMDASGAPYEIKSDPIRPGGDLQQGARDTAQRLLAERKPPS